MRPTTPFVFLLLPTLGLAQDPTSPAVNQAPPARAIRGASGLDTGSMYFFRGMLQEDQGIIAQPWVELGTTLIDGPEHTGPDTLDLTFGLWNSLHDGPTGSSGPRTGGPGAAGSLWYESDFYVDLAARFGERLDLATRYTAYTSPNGFFDPARRRGFRTTVEEVALTASYDDRELLLDAVANGLQPHVTIAFELSGQRDNGTQRGIYGEVGVAPSFALGEIGSSPVTLTVPLTFGMSLTDYYEDQAGGRDEFFGYLSVGAVLTMPLGCMPERFGCWTCELGLTALMLGDNLEERNDGDTSEVVLTFGVATKF
ncbi:MAG: hypothetical protein WAT39_10925 [Planctomycetota bacterium]